MPLTIPEVPTVAIVVLALLHVPPGLASASGVVEPWHTEVAPVMAATLGFTVIVRVVKFEHPAPLVTA